MKFQSRFSVMMLATALITAATLAHAVATEIQLFPPVVEGTVDTTCAPGARAPLTWDGQSNVACAEGVAIAGGNVTIANGKLGVGTVLPASQLANNSTNRLDYTGNGLSTTAINWTASAPGYVAGFENLSAGNYFNGLLVKTADVSGNSNILDLMSGGSSHFIVNGNGNVGINTTDPQYVLDINVPFSPTGSGIRLYGDNFNGGVGIVIANNIAGGNSWSLVSEGGSSAPVGSFGIYDNHLPGERLVILDNGDVGIGTPTPGWMGALLQVEGNITVEGNNPWAFSIHNPVGGPDQTIWVPLQAVGNELRSYVANDANDASTIYQMVIRNGNSIGSVDFPSGNVGIGNMSSSYVLDVSGQARFTGNYTTSDRRLKTNVADIGYGLDTVMKLHPVFFDWKKPVKGEEGRRVGFIAQEVRQVIPELVSIAPDAMQTEAVEYGNVTPVLVKAIQQLKSENDDLQARVAADDAAVAANDAEIAAMKAKLGM